MDQEGTAYPLGNGRMNARVPVTKWESNYRLKGNDYEICTFRGETASINERAAWPGVRNSRW